MNPPILHHYPVSPFAEKVRAMLGYKKLAWQSVVIPMIMPKPELVALTGGYRRTPVLQTGADVWCDTALIARVLERLAPQPSLWAYGDSIFMISEDGITFVIDAGEEEGITVLLGVAICAPVLSAWSISSRRTFSCVQPSSSRTALRRLAAATLQVLPSRCARSGRTYPPTIGRSIREVNSDRVNRRQLSGPVRPGLRWSQPGEQEWLAETDLISPATEPPGCPEEGPRRVAARRGRRIEPGES